MAAELLEPRVVLSATLISITGPTDLIYDSTRNQLDIPTTTGIVGRFDIASQLLITPFNVNPAGLTGGDITPDGSSIYVGCIANGNSVQNGGSLIKINVASGTQTTLTLPQTGITPWDVAISASGTGLMSYAFSGSGAASPDILNTSTDSVTASAPFSLGDSKSGQPMSRSYDRSTFVVSPSGGNGGTVFLYSPATGLPLGYRQFSSFQSSPPATNNDGSMSAVYANGNLTVLDSGLNTLHEFTNLPNGMAFDPTRHVLYAADLAAQVVIGISTDTWQPVLEVPLGGAYTQYTIAHQSGAMTVSNDGNYLFLTTSGGVLEISIPAQTASVSGAVTDQTHGTGLAGWQVYADTNNNGKYDPDEPVATTDAQGHYTLSGLVAGNYTIHEVTPADWHLTAPASSSYSYQLAAGQAATGANFSNTPFIKITGTVYGDTNDNQVFDSGTEAGLSGWTVFLDANQNRQLDTGEMSTTTDANGQYTFNTVPSGTFDVRAVQKTNFVTFGGATVSTQPPALISCNFGETTDTLISGNVYWDKQGTGVFNPAVDPGLNFKVYADLNNCS